jgi:hypothetical protein
VIQKHDQKRVYDLIYDQLKTLNDYQIIKYKNVVLKKTFKTEKISCQLLPSIFKDFLVPCTTGADGNCLYRAILLCVYGNEDFHVEIRYLVVLSY